MQGRGIISALLFFIGETAEVPIFFQEAPTKPWVGNLELILNL